MPELAEVKLTADYINTSTHRKTFTQIKKNPIHKCEDVNINYQQFYLHAVSRGKELVLFISDANSVNYIPLRMTMGMSGHFSMTETGQEAKHAHLMFLATNNTTLSFVDVRRFGKWKVNYSWSSNRGPCPLEDNDAFALNIMNNLHKKIFNKPIFEILMNQQYFNGIGNYIRCELIGRIGGLNPFINARDAIKQYPQILTYCHDIPNIAYNLLKGTKNNINTIQLKTNKSNFNNFLKYYRNKNKCFPIKDKNGRTYWCDKKWKYLIN